MLGAESMRNMRFSPFAHPKAQARNFMADFETSLRGQQDLSRVEDEQNGNGFFEGDFDFPDESEFLNFPQSLDSSSVTPRPSYFTTTSRAPSFGGFQPSSLQQEIRDSKFNVPIIETFGDWVGDLQQRFQTNSKDVKPDFPVPIGIEGNLIKLNISTAVAYYDLCCRGR